MWTVARVSIGRARTERAFTGALAAVIGLVAAFGCSSKSVDAPARSSSAERPPAASISASADAPPATPSEARRAAVEKSLLPFFDVVDAGLAMKLADRMTKWGVPAVGIAVVSDGKLDWAHTYGVLAFERDTKDRSKETPANEETVFQAASISKPITAMAVLALVDQKKIDLDKPVNGYLRAWKLDDSVYTKDHPVTVRALLSHTATINAPEQQLYTTAPESFGGYKPDKPVPTTLQVLEGAPPALTVPVEAMKEPPCADAATTPPSGGPRGPKGCFSYSGGGYTILQLLVEEVAGQPFGEAVKRLVFEPIGMTHSSFSDAPPTPNAARAHRGDARTPPGGWVVVAEKAAGGLWTTPTDLALFLLDLSASYRGEEGHVLTEATAKAMLTPVADARPLVGASIALGMFVSDDGGELVFSHNGHNPGYHGTIVAIPDQKKALVLLMNREVGVEVLPEIGNAIGEVYDWPARSGMRAQKKTRVPVVKEALTKLEGKYTGGGLFDKPLRATVRVDGERLFAKIDERDDAELYPSGEGEFVEPFAPAIVRFKVDQDGVSLEYDAPTGKRSATRDEPHPP